MSNEEFKGFNFNDDNYQFLLDIDKISYRNPDGSIVTEELDEDEIELHKIFAEAVKELSRKDKND